MADWRVTVKCSDAEAATSFKERFFKQLYSEQGTTLVFEVPDEETAKPIVTAAEEAGHTAEAEEHKDPLEDAEPVDFW